jgi:hypothetical protein
MSSNVTRRALDVLGMTGILGLAAYGVFCLPYSFPSASVVKSQSFDAGFNNRISVLAALAAIGLLFVRNLWWRQTATESVDSLFGCAMKPGSRILSMPRSLLLFFAAIYVAAPVLLCLGLQGLGGWGEAASSLPRFELGWRYHLCLYSEINWAYGPALYYIPTAFIAVGQHLGVEVDLAYLACFIVISLAGLWMLFFVVDNLRIKVSHRVLVFSVVALCCWSESLGVNYTLLRFALPYAMILVVHKTAQRMAPLTDPRAIVKLSAVCIGCALAVLSISIELGLGYVVAQTAYLVHRRVHEGRRWTWTILSTVVAPLLLATAFPDCLQTLDSFSKGGNNFPVLPGIHIILYLLSLLWVVPLAAATCATRRTGESTPVLLAWTVLAIATIPAALGRCDFVHVLFNGIGVFLLTMALLARFHPRLFPMYAVLFITLFGIVGRVVNVGFAAAMGQTAPLLRTLVRVPVAADSEPSPLIADLNLGDYSAIAIPMGSDCTVRRWLIETGRFVPQSHPDYVNVVSPADLNAKIEGLAKADAVLVPDWVPKLREKNDEQFRTFREQKMPAYDQACAQTVGLLLLFPISYQSKYIPFDPKMMEARYISTSFRVVRASHGWAIMTPEK